MGDQRIFFLELISKCSIFKAFLTEIRLTNYDMSNILEDCPICLFFISGEMLVNYYPPRNYLYLVTVPKVREYCSHFQ